MREIRVVEKPDWVSFETIHDVIYSAHEENRKNGFNVKTALMNSKELQEYIGKRGKCFIALDGNRVVGTTSYRIVERNYWCVKGPVMDRILVAILPEYQGMHISTKLFQKIRDEAKKQGIEYIETQTAEKNKIMQKIARKEGFKYIRFTAPDSDHYNVIMLQWLEKSSYPNIIIVIRYLINMIYIKLRYKPGRIKRFNF